MAPDMVPEVIICSVEGMTSLLSTLHAIQLESRARQHGSSKAAIVRGKRVCAILLYYIFIKEFILFWHIIAIAVSLSL